MKYLIVGIESPVAVALATRLLLQDCAVVATHSDPLSDTTRELAEQGSGRITFTELDLSDIPLVTRFSVDQQDPFDAVIYAHIYFEMEPDTGFDEQQWSRSIIENLNAPAALLYANRNLLKPGGSVVVVTSTEAFRGSYRGSAYASTKAAAHNLVMSLANVYGPSQIRANAVAAGWIGGVMDTDEVFNMSRKITPLGRLGSPEEVANVIAFLVSKDASFVNGSVVTVDGGYTGVDTIAKYESEPAN